MPSPTRLCLRTNQTEYRHLVWFQNNKLNEMLVGIYGLQEKQPVLKYMWPERELDSAELSSVRYDFTQMMEVGCKVDHITCHADGTFHIKKAEKKDEEAIYIQGMRRTEPLGPKTSTFLELTLISDLAENYPISDKSIKYPHVWVDLPSDQFVAFLGMFSGISYDLERDMAGTMAQFKGVFGGVRLVSGTIKGLLVGHPKILAEDARKSRPRGTILSFKFPAAENLWHIKTFLFQ